MNDIAALARQTFSYDPETGVLLKNGKRVGWRHSSGYRYVCFNGSQHLEHRVIWLIVNGSFPDGEIDHKNRIKDDNRLDNIRDASKSENQRNTGLRRDNSTGFKGVTYNKQHNRFLAKIRKNGRREFLGYFNSPELAAAAYLSAATPLKQEQSNG